MFCKNIYTADMKYVIKQQVDNHHNDYNISRAPWDERTLAISNCLQLKCINFAYKCHLCVIQTTILEKMVRKYHFENANFCISIMGLCSSSYYQSTDYFYLPIIINLSRGIWWFYRLFLFERC